MKRVLSFFSALTVFWGLFIANTAISSACTSVIASGRVAPDGYLVRSNFSFNGRPIKEGKGHLRYEQADLMVKKGENPNLITMWTIISYPAATVAMPVWVKGGAESIPEMMRADVNVDEIKALNEVADKRVAEFYKENFNLE